MFVGFAGAWLIRIVAPTLRFRVEDESGIAGATVHPEPVIFAFWHNRMFLMPHIYRRHFPGRRAVCLVSMSEDGEMIARVLARFGLAAARGSTSRKGKEAYRRLVENLKQGWDVAITPDGPRGPRYQAQVGVVGLAALSSHALVPVSYNADWRIELPSWDGFMIPLPFSRCSLHFGKPMTFSSSARDEALEAGRADLENRLNAFHPPRETKP